jgi:DNA polymerase III subunit alpha
MTGEPQHAAPASTTTPTVTVMRPRQRIQIARKDDERPAAPAPSGPQYHLHLTLTRSDDFEADVRCMQEVGKILRNFAGTHELSLYVPRNDCNVVLKPMQGVNPIPELISALQTILSESQVQLESAT